MWGESSKEKTQNWEKFLIPNKKTERMEYFNSITKELYESAFAAKQTQFQAYLDGQRRFRWGIKSEVRDVTKRLDAYRGGLIPKENIAIERYREYPNNVKVDDVQKCQRIVSHVSATLASLGGIEQRLRNRKKELYGQDLKVRSWASNELQFVDDQLSLLEPMVKETQSLLNDVSHVQKQLSKRFGEADILKSERKRKARRAIEHKSKMKKQRKIKDAKTIEVSSSDSDSGEMPCDI